MDEVDREFIPSPLGTSSLTNIATVSSNRNFDSWAMNLEQKLQEERQHRELPSCGLGCSTFTKYKQTLKQPFPVLGVNQGRYVSKSNFVLHGQPVFKAVRSFPSFYTQLTSGHPVYVSCNSSCFLCSCTPARYLPDRMTFDKFQLHHNRLNYQN